MTPEETQAARDKIRDQGLRFMDAIARTKGENDPMFWAAMAVTTDNLAAFDKRQREQK